MHTYAGTVRPKDYRGSDPLKLDNYRRQCGAGRQIGVFLDKAQAKVDREEGHGQILSFIGISETLRIPIEDVKACLWNRNGGGDCGITLFRSRSHE